ncbi:MAG: hypothetical protein L0H55_12710 [Candidatus Nitrosocosmicus sp.]|nr:hypothetical protein [Candidatus Nitrosocosmicus sp.]
MTINSPNSNNSVDKDKFTYKYIQCYGNNCNEIGNNPLKIIFINKVGWFCNICKDDLLKLQLVENIGEK